nr:Osmotically inducible protein [uncultured bacterium]
MSRDTTHKSCMTLNLGNYLEFLRAVEQDPSKARFSFSAKTSWKGGAATETVARDRVIAADEPEAFGGGDTAADPVELVLAALTSCVSIGLVTQAAKRGVDFEDFEMEVVGDMDLRGYLGLDDEVRPGYEKLEYVVRVKTDAPESLVAEMLAAAERTSPMFDTIRNGVAVSSRLEVLPASRVPALV